MHRNLYRLLMVSSGGCIFPPTRCGITGIQGWEGIGVLVVYFADEIKGSPQEKKRAIETKHSFYGCQMRAILPVSLLKVVMEPRGHYKAHRSKLDGSVPVWTLNQLFGLGFRLKFSVQIYEDTVLKILKVLCIRCADRGTQCDVLF